MKEKRLMGKEEFCKILQANVEKVTGKNLSLVDVWDIFKVCVYTPYEVSNTEDVRISIPKIGVFTTSKILDSYQKDGKVRPKFYGSSGIEDALTNNISLIDALANSYTARQREIGVSKPEEVETKTEPETKKEAKVEPKKEVKVEPKEVKPKEAKKEKVVKEEPEETSNDLETVSDDDFDFDFI